MLKYSSAILGLAVLLALPLPGYGQPKQHMYDEEEVEVIEPAARAAVRERLAGPDRYGTAIAVTTKRFNDQSADKVYIASGENFPDAISVTSLIAQVAPADPKSAVLLSPTAGLTPDVLGEVRRLIKPSGTVVLIGGTEALAPVVSDQLTKLIPNVKVDRIAGPTRVETAIAIGDAVHTLGPIEEVVVTPAADYRIAIVASALTAKHQAVQLNSPATHDGKMHPAVQNWIETVKPKQVTIVGPADFLSGWTHPKVQRITGERAPDRVDPDCPSGLACTSSNPIQPAGADQVIAEELLVKEFADSAHHILVSRERAVDGIAASQFAVQQHAPILPVSATSDAANRYAYLLRDKGKRPQITFWAIGGEQAITEQAFKTLAEVFSN